MRHIPVSFRRALPALLVFLVCVAIAFVLLRDPAPTTSIDRGPSLIHVAVQTIQRTEYPIILRSRGIVRALTESLLAAEVPGKVVAVSPSLRPGKFFDQGEVLLRIDDRDYVDRTEIAEAELVQAQSTLLEEQTRTDLARREGDMWLGSGQERSLALRESQLASAEAGVRRAEAELAVARRNLTRTKVIAPYAGRVLEKFVDTGQYLTSGTELASIFATDALEVRLPLGPREIEWLRSSADSGGSGNHHAPEPLRVRLTAPDGMGRRSWSGRIARVEGSIDPATGQQFVVASIDGPYHADATGQPAPQLGQFVAAEISGRRLEDVLVIPVAALQAGDSVFVADSMGRLSRREVAVLWRDGDHLVLSDGLESGEQLVTTRLPLATSGMQVRIVSRDGRRVVDSLGTERNQRLNTAYTLR